MSIIYVNKNEIYVVDNNFNISKEPFSYKKGIVTTSIRYEDVYNISFKLPTTILEENIEVEIHKYLFTKASLNYKKDYQITYDYKRVGEYFLINAYIVEVEELKKLFEKELETFKYIDFISLDAKAFTSYYEITSKLETNDIFIVLTEKEAFLSLFSNGEFLFASTLIGIKNLLKDLNIDEKELKILFQTKGLVEENYNDKERFNIIQTYFSDFFIKVSNIINSSANYYQIGNINRIFFYSSFEIKGFLEKYKEIWKNYGVEFDLYKFVNHSYDPFEYTKAIYNASHYKDDKLNFSIFKRPPPLYKRVSGQIFLTFIGVFFILLADYLIKEYIIYSQNNEINILKQKFDYIKKQNKLNENMLKNYKKDINNLRAEIRKYEKKISYLKSKIYYLLDMKESKVFLNQLMDIVYLLKKYNLKITSFSKNDKEYIVTVISKKNATKIALFMKDLSSIGYKNVFANKIEHLDNFYRAEVHYND